MIIVISILILALTSIIIYNVAVKQMLSPKEEIKNNKQDTLKEKYLKILEETYKEKDAKFVFVKETDKEMIFKKVYSSGEKKDAKVTYTINKETEQIEEQYKIESVIKGK